MPEFCDESKALIKKIIQTAATLEILEADLRNRFAMTVYYEFDEDRAVYEDGHRRTKNMTLKSSSVTMPLPPGLNEAGEPDKHTVSIRATPGADGASKVEQRPEPPPKPPKAES